VKAIKRFGAIALVAGTVLAVGGIAQATPVCTNGYMGGPPLAACGNRVFPEVPTSVDYVQYLPDPQTGFREYQHGLEYLEELYPRWISVFTLRSLYGEDAVSMGPDRQRSYAEGDTGDGYDIFVVKITDHTVPDDGKQRLLYSLSVHGDEKGGLEGGVRAAEDLAMAAEDGGFISDGVPGYDSTTGRDPVFHTYRVREVLAKEVVYLIDFNIDGFVRGDHFSPSPGLYTRGNWAGTDLNRQMPTVGWINSQRNPLEESEMLYGHTFMHEVAAAGVDGKMAYGADVHGEGQSRAWADIMYPAGQFDSIKHRQLMAIAERTKSVMDDTLFLGGPDAIEELTGGDGGEGLEDYGAPKNTIPTKPARWGTVWDTLGYTDTGFIGDYMANELGVTGMDYEIALNHADSRAYGRPWSIFLQENYVNATRAIIKTAMAYAMYQEEEFADFQIDPKGKVGYLYNPDTVTDGDEDGPGAGFNDTSRNGEPIVQRPYEATNMQFFEDEAKYIKGGLDRVLPADIASDPEYLDSLDSLVVADVFAPEDAQGRSYDPAAYAANIRSWVERGGNLVLTDKALHLLGQMGVIPAGDIRNINVYQPYSNIADLGHPMAAGLRGNARQLAEFTLIGYPIGSSASPMTIVNTPAWTAAGGHVVGTTGNNTGGSDSGTQVSVGELALGAGRIRILGGGLGTPTEANDHRYGLKDYSLTYSGLYILENSIVHDAGGLGDGTATSPVDNLFPFLGLLPLTILARQRRTKRARRQYR
jgi:hypothetical protein